VASRKISSEYLASSVRQWFAERRKRFGIRAQQCLIADVVVIESFGPGAEDSNHHAQRQRPAPVLFDQVEKVLTLGQCDFTREVAKNMLQRVDSRGYLGSSRDDTGEDRQVLIERFVRGPIASSRDNSSQSTKPFLTARHEQILVPSMEFY